MGTDRATGDNTADVKKIDDDKDSDTNDDKGDEHSDEDAKSNAENIGGTDTEPSDEGIDITEKMFDWCIAELRHKSKSFQQTGAISVFDGDVVKSDTAILPSIRDALITAAAKLEDVPDFHRDWHPGSNETVLDLVHPSLYPVVYGRTRILPDSLTGLDDCITRCGEGLTLDVPPKEDCALWVQRQFENKSPDTNYLLQDPFSRKFQWLPCEVAFSESDEVKYVICGYLLISALHLILDICDRITSYINNLHPHQHKDLYDVIEKIIAEVIPLWNMTLTPLQKDMTIPPRIVYTSCDYDPDPYDMPEEERPQQEEDEDEDDYNERLGEWEEEIRELILPEPEEFTPRFAPESALDLKNEFGQRGLQVIVKLANIHLTPEKPQYDGGTWHVEGQLVRLLLHYNFDNN